MLCVIKFLEMYHEYIKISVAVFTDHPRLKPSSFLNEDLCSTFAKDYMFFGCIQYIHQVILSYILTYTPVCIDCIQYMHYHSLLGLGLWDHAILFTTGTGSVGSCHIIHDWNWDCTVLFHTRTGSVGSCSVIFITETVSVVSCCIIHYCYFDCGIMPYYSLLGLELWDHVVLLTTGGVGSCSIIH